ncbi:hypothetical protein RRF57_002812 [Xylaria bambusicola]|uniref:Uncharacterized protein n=1 Tax=Xylaria bambusicola TaxID=326684 RepID=A0AAN7Z2T6_9PEZI
MASAMVNGDPDLHGETRLKAYNYPLCYWHGCSAGRPVQKRPGRLFDILDSVTRRITKGLWSDSQIDLQYYPALQQ